MMAPAAGEKTPDEQGSAMASNRQIRRAWEADDRHAARHFARSDEDRQAARPRASRKRRRYALADSFDQADASERAVQRAQQLAVETVVGLAKEHKRRESEPDDEPGGLEFGLSGPADEDDEPDPVEQLLHALDAYTEDGRPEFGRELVTVLAQLGAAAVLQLSESTGRKPGKVARALLARLDED